MLINPINLFKSMTKKRGQMVAMYSSKINISYSQLDELSDIFAGNLTLLGIKKCDRVAIQIERSVVFFGLIIAL
jgi:non-ribosomal peptide synthetase component E (peptide arylation enzyme)